MNTIASSKEAKSTRQHSKPQKFLKSGEVKLLLGVSDETIRTLTKHGELEHYVIGKQLRFTRKAINDYLDACHNAKAKAA